MSMNGRYGDPDHWRFAQEASWQDKLAELRHVELSPKTPGQAAFLKSIDDNKLTLCIGPAGSGKSMLSCGRAAQLLKSRKVEKVIITRPLVACGKGYGFLPGERREKIEPFMRPMLDYFKEFMTPTEVERHLRDGSLEMFPLDDMRGATFKNTFLLCDEAQNAEFSQLHMLLTRFGSGSKFVVCGDVSRTQTDLQHRGENPMREVLRRVESRGGNPEIGIIRLTRKDIVRDGLVQWIDEALGDDVTEAWYDLKCPQCKSRLWYCNGDEAETGHRDQESVQCYSCQAGIRLWDDDDQFSPHLSSVTRAVPTFPEKP